MFVAAQICGSQEVGSLHCPGLKGGLLQEVYRVALVDKCVVMTFMYLSKSVRC